MGWRILASSGGPGVYLDRGGMIYNVRAYGAQGDRRTVHDAGITSGSAIVTSATIAFTQADVGKRIRVTDSPESTVRLNGTILSVQSATQATASVNSGVTLSNEWIEVGTDDTVAIQATIDAPGGKGGIAFFPPGDYLITATLTCRVATQLIGSGAAFVPQSSTSYQTMLWATSITNTPAIAGPTSSIGFTVKGLGLTGPGTNTAGSSSVGIYGGFAAKNTVIEDCVVRNFYKGLSLQNDQNTIIRGGWIDNSGFACLFATNSFNLLSEGCLYSNQSLTNTADAGNVVLDGGCEGVTIIAAAIDEGFAQQSTSGCIVVKNALDVTIQIPVLYYPNLGNGIYIGAAARRVTVIGTRLLAFDTGTRVPTQTIKIVAGAVDTRLINVTTEPNGGGDISDAGTRTTYIGCVLNGVPTTSGLAAAVSTLSVDATLTAADSGKTFRVTGVDKIATLPSTAPGITYVFFVSAAALSGGTGFSISPAALDKIMGTGITSADDKDLINAGATDTEGDTVTLVGDGIDGWYVQSMRGVWIRQA